MNLDRLALCVAASLFAHQAQAEPVRLAEGFRDIAGLSLRDFGFVGAAINRQGISVQASVKGAFSCRDLMSIPFGREESYDRSFNALQYVHHVKVGCWALSKFDTSRPTGTLIPTDYLTPEIARDIMDRLLELSESNVAFGKALLMFPDYLVHCRNEERCEITWPDNSGLSGYWGEFRLLLADGEERFIQASSSYLGRHDFVFGVRWRNTDTGGEVVEVFPDIDPP